MQILNLSGITTTHKKLIKGVISKDAIEVASSRQFKNKNQFNTNNTLTSKIQTPSTINLNFQNFSNSLTNSNRKQFIQKDVNEYSDKNQNNIQTNRSQMFISSINQTRSTDEIKPGPLANSISVLPNIGTKENYGNKKPEIVNISV